MKKSTGLALLGLFVTTAFSACSNNKKDDSSDILSWKGIQKEQKQELSKAKDHKPVADWAVERAAHQANLKELSKYQNTNINDIDGIQMHLAPRETALLLSILETSKDKMVVNFFEKDQHGEYILDIAKADKNRIGVNISDPTENAKGTIRLELSRGGDSMMGYEQAHLNTVYVDGQKSDDPDRTITELEAKYNGLAFKNKLAGTHASPVIQKMDLNSFAKR